jgi:predicted O-linked N-acetylglucosamine transferase (SPINDLY family)
MLCVSDCLTAFCFQVLEYNYYVVTNGVMSELAQFPESDVEKIQALLHQDQLQQAILICEAQLSSPGIATGPISWLYGLALLLNDQEEDAQAAWMMAMMAGDEAEVATWLGELGDTLDQNADFQAARCRLPQASLIRCHIREILPNDYSNLLKLIKLELLQKTFTLKHFFEFEIIELLKSEISNNTFSNYPELLLEILELYLDAALADEITVHFVAALRPYLPPERFVIAVYNGAMKIAHVRSLHGLAVPLLELCFELAPQDSDLLIHLAELLILIQSYRRAVEIGRQIATSNHNPVTQVISSYYVLKAYLNEGKDRSVILKSAQEHESNLKLLIENPPNLTYSEVQNLIAAVHLLSYISDRPQQYRVAQNQIMAMCEKSIQAHWVDHCQRYRHRASPDHRSQMNQSLPDRPLRIGYICSCFYNHSVGWLARSLIQHHDTQKFEIYIYGVNIPPSAHPVSRFYQQVTPHYRACDCPPDVIADQIHQDQIDILIDLDSITRDSVCTVMALKPAPIQATWMGWDAIGLSSIDYYIADHYSLPDNAQDYYVERIWRLPQTFLAVDGFEIGIPTIRRSDLNIPEDAIIFLNPQRGYKLTPEILKLQLQILKATPNSYLLLKGITDDESLQQSLGELTSEIGVAIDRLRPLPYAPSEEIHRANLAIADVILDTFPYNGATTTMESLWMERPIVTLVGKQFSARNSYTMMMNAGITEGISWTPEEYVNWGIRFGTEPQLRQQLAGKLRQAKQAAPLWNGQAFARQMEAAYVQMSKIYVEQADT